ncbi:hypothetical protein GCM10022255_083430 [Dactylosporangium darangshiense]|uniref:DAD domain-containing protein n=1 Tax=Dactylosporangium darangshiense TaxID=579108 RepID=A0ABP8DLX6_9ACTN
MTPWWQAVDEAVESLVAALTAAAARAARRSERRTGRKRGRTGPKNRTQGIRRHLADVIRARRLAPGLAVDHKTVSALFAGHRGLVTDQALVVAVARACALVAGRKLTSKEADRLRTASARIAKLIARAEAADRAAAPPPAVAAPTPPAVAAPTPAVVPAPAPPAVPAPAPPPVILVPEPAPAPVPVVVPVQRPRWVLIAVVLLVLAAILVALGLTIG